MLTFSNVFKSYKDFPVLKNISFKVEKGKITAILGANGAGKSTLIKLAAGIITPDSGDILINTLTPQNKKTRQFIGYLAENENIAENEEVFNWLKTISLIKGKDEKEAERVFLLCKLNKVAGRLIGNLSKGYKKRLAMAAALVGNPPVLLLDEPAFGLDPIQTDETVNIIKNMSKESAILVSTHSIDEAQSMAEKIIILSKGELKADFEIKDVEKTNFLNFVLKVSKGQNDISNILSQVGALNIKKNFFADYDEYIVFGEKDLAREIVKILKRENIDFLEIYSFKKSLKEKVKEFI